VSISSGTLAIAANGEFSLALVAAPRIASLNPSTAAAGSASFTLTVDGANFVDGATVMWNGAPRPTTFGSSARLTASISAADIATAGTISITVANPGAGGEISNAHVFTITGSPSSNLLTNGGFEADGNGDGKPDNWTSNSKFTRSNAVTPVQGAYVGRFRATDNTGATIQQVVQNVTAGTAYSFSGSVRIPSTSDAFTFKLQVRWRNASNSVISTKVIKTYTTHTSNAWNRATANQTLVAPTGTTNAQVQMVVSSLNGTIYVDHFVLNQGALVAAETSADADGAMSADPGALTEHQPEADSNAAAP
jgi:hypothetical protein